jgi:hypothetical protein
MPFVAARPERYVGQAVGEGANRGQCVAFVRAAANVPHTSLWVRGDPVEMTDLPRGCAIATFGRSGKYENRGDGSSHAAIFLQQHDAGISVFDQWVDHTVAQRVIRSKDGAGPAADDASRYYVIEVAAVPDD